MHNFSKFQKLSSEEKKRLRQAFIWLPLVHGGLKILGYSRLTRLLFERAYLNSARAGFGAEDDIRDAMAASRMVSIAARYGLCRASCLSKSLVLMMLLRQQGIVGELCFGARLSGHCLEAHAWVEVHGKVVNDRPDIRQKYPPLSGRSPSLRTG